MELGTAVNWLWLKVVTMHGLLEGKSEVWDGNRARTHKSFDYSDVNNSPSTMKEKGEKK